jgi:flagellar biosynthesis protein FliP
LSTVQQGNTVQPTIPFERDGGTAFASSGVGVLLASLLVITTVPKRVPAVAIGALVAVSARAADPAIGLPDMQTWTDGAGGDMPATVKILLGLTAAGLAPGILMPTTAFVLIVIFLPFPIVDPIDSSAPLTLGMIMVPPASISLPLTTLVVAVVAGWALVVRLPLGTSS